MCRNLRQPAANVMAALPFPCLALVTDRSLAHPLPLLERINRAVAGGVDLVQLREKDLPGGPLLELAGGIKDSLPDSVLLLINERVDVAAALGVDGVQLGEAALPVPKARRILGPDALIGRSVHSLEGALAAEAEGADFLVVGTMFASRSHLGEEPAGPQLLGEIGAECSLPMLGIGGITAGNVAQVMAAGAAGAAVISAILGAPDPEAAARELKETMLASLERARAGRQEELASSD